MSLKTAAGAADFEAGKQRRLRFLAILRSNKYRTIPEVAAQVPISMTTYYKWRSMYKDFAAEVDADIRPNKPITSNTAWDQGFAAFRKKFFGFDSPWFHIRIIDALENSEPGSVTLITIPPEHGKTTLLEDWVGYKLAMNPTFRITIGSETVTHAQKFIGRVQNRMEPDGPTRPYVHRFGPFIAPKESTQARRQTWSQTRMNVFKKGRFDERDYSLSGLGMTGKIRGTRTDLLIVDDPQSEETLGQSTDMFRKFRHDWLSRPGSKGRTVILMTRVGEGDFAELLLNSEILDHHIMLPAYADSHPGNTGWLWPERYDVDEYDRMRRNVGEDGWDLSYMQIARPKGTITFQKEIIEKGRDNLRTCLHVADRLNGSNIMVGLDPGYGVTGLTAAADVPGIGPGGGKFEIVSCRKRRRLSGIQPIVSELADLVRTVHSYEHPVTDLVIESMAFQKGLLEDPGIILLQKQFGFRIHPHETGLNKSDMDIGVPQMVNSLLREEISWPYADLYSMEEMAELEADMYRWLPGSRGRGTKIEQDCLMSTWFIWLLWRSWSRRAQTLDVSQFVTRPAPPLMGVGRR